MGAVFFLSTKRLKTRMHSSSSSRQGDLQAPPPPASSPSTSPLGVGLNQIPLNFCLGCGSGPDPPQLPPWLWAWTRSPSTSPLGVGLDQIPLGCGPGDSPRTRHPRTRHPSPGPDTHPPGPGTPTPGPGTLPPWTETLTHATQNITLPQTSFAGGNKRILEPIFMKRSLVFF